MPTDLLKVIVVERNGADLADAEEVLLAAQNVQVNSSSFVSDNVKAALEEIAAAVPLTNNFSYKLVSAAQTITIAEEQQMLAYDEVEIANTGELVINGEMVILT